MKPQKLSKPKKILFWLVIILLASWITVWGGYSFLKVWKLDRKVARLEKELSVVKAQNDSLTAVNNRLKTDPSAAEEVAREQFGMIKPDETVWVFKPAPASGEAKTKTK